MIKNIYEMLQDVCARNSDRVFFVRQNETYADLLRMVKKRAVNLATKFGIKPGDTVAILSGNTPEFIKSYFAITAIGGRALMLDTGLASSEHLNMMAHTNTKLVLAQKSFFVDGAPETVDIEMSDDDADESKFIPADCELSDLAMLSFTSGSTGNPKVVGLTHGNVVAVCYSTSLYVSSFKPGYMFYGFLPLYHIYGFVINIIVPLGCGCSLLLQPVFKPTEFLKDFQKYHPEIIPAVPRIWEGFYKKIIDGYREKKKYKLLKIILSCRGFLRAIGLGFLVNKVTKPIHDLFGGNLKILITAGATFKPRVRKFYESAGFAVGDCYGLTETTGPANFNFEFILPDGKKSYAGPLSGNEIKIHNPDKNGIGDVWTRGSVVMPGYIDNDAANAEAFEDGWFKTGDIGTIDKLGRLTIKGRKKQVIVLENGKNVYPDELEDLYMANDEILGAAVIEFEVRGRVVPYGVFQVKPGTSALKIGLLIRASNLAIAPYKWVKHFAITENELPMTSAKKIKHFEIREMLNRGEFSTHTE